jgi:hypothetical protein
VEPSPAARLEQGTRDEFCLRHHRHEFDRNRELWVLSRALWLAYFKSPIDTLKSDWREVLSQLRSYFFKASWNEVYDFTEFVVGAYPRAGFREAFCVESNRILEREKSAYRFVNEVLTRIVDEVEIEEIEVAARTSRGPVAQHPPRIGVDV